MSTHGCFAPPFPLSYTRLLRPDVGVQEPDAIVEYDYYYSGGADYYVQPADDDLELYLDLMTTRTGYLIKHTLPSARYNR